MTTGETEAPNGTTRDESITDHRHRRGLWGAVVAASLVSLLVVGAFAASGLIDVTASGDSGPAAAAAGDERVERFNGAFPIPNASGVGIQETAVFDATNDTVYVFGAASCTAGEILEVRVNVTQESTGAIASGDTAAYCLGPNFVQTWIVLADPVGASGFEAGDARVDAWARTQVDGETTDTIRWNRTVDVSETYPDRSTPVTRTPSPTATDTPTATETPAATEQTTETETPADTETTTETADGDGY